MKTIKVKIEEVKINPANPRVITEGKFGKLVKSIKDFPEMLELRPIVVNKEMVVLGGNMRLKACLEAGLKEIPIIIAENLTEAQQNEFLIKDNVSGGEWDFNILADSWETDLLNDWGIDVPIFDFGEFEEADDISTNNKLGKHTDDYAIDYLNSDFKKFEIFVMKDQYELFNKGLDTIKAKYNLDNNSDAVIKIISEYK